MESASDDSQAGAVSVGGLTSEAEGFAQWIRPYWLDLHRLANRMCGPIDGEDVLQDALASAWRKRATFDPSRGQPRAWLLAIVADQARKVSKRAAKRSTELIDELSPREAPGTEHLDLGAAVQLLPDRQRLAVNLFYYLDMPVAETAEVMACSAGTVKSTLFDAREQLRRLLGADYR